MPVRVRDVHAQSLATSSALSEYYIPNFIPPLEVFRALNAAKVRFMLVGTHAMGGWTRKPRTTTEVDILVATQLHARALHSPTCCVSSVMSGEDHEDETRLLYAETGQALIDVMKANQPLYRAAFRYSHRVQWEGQTYRIPSLELALAMKFSAMMSATRGYADRHGDAGDFIGIVESNEDINSRKLHTLGQLVYNGGGNEIVERVRRPAPTRC